MGQALQSAEQYPTTRSSDIESGDEHIVEGIATAESATLITRAPRSAVFSSSGDAAAPTLDRFLFTTGRVGVKDHKYKSYALLPPLPTSINNGTMSSESPTRPAAPAPDSATKGSIIMRASPTGPHSDESWQDETTISIWRQSARPSENSMLSLSDLVKNYNWYPGAVAIDALLPPGVTLSAKRFASTTLIIHPGYTGVFRGPYEEHMSPLVMNQIQRDAVQHLLPAFKKTGYEGKGDADMYTDHLEPGAYLEKNLKGDTVPTFDDLLRLLKFLPSGPDARELTRCLTWYLDICHTFTPKFELNVLHTQALIRALRQPLQPVVSQNMNPLALEQWRGQRAFPSLEVTITARDYGDTAKDEHHTAECSRPQAVFNIHKDPGYLKMHICIPLRNILAFPFLALHGVIGEAFGMGIDKAERRRRAHKGMETPMRHATANNIKQEKTPQRTPKRPRQSGFGELMTPAQTPKRQRKLDDESGELVTRMPKRPTVSPITPRASTQRLGLKKPTKLPIKLEPGLSKPDIARFESWR